MPDKTINIENKEGGVINLYYNGNNSQLSSAAEEDVAIIRMASIDKYSSPLMATVSVSPWGQHMHKVSLFVINTLIGQVIQQNSYVYKTELKARQNYQKIIEAMKNYKTQAEQGLMHSAIISEKIRNDMLEFKGDIAQPDSDDLSKRYISSGLEDAGVPAGLLTYDHNHFPTHNGAIYEEETVNGNYNDYIIECARRDQMNELYSGFMKTASKSENKKDVYFELAKTIEENFRFGESYRDIISLYCALMLPESDESRDLKVIKKAGLNSIRPIISNLEYKNDYWIKAWVGSNPDRIEEAITHAYGVAFEKAASDLGVKKIEIDDYDLFIFDADFTIWDSDVPAMAMDADNIQFIDANTIRDSAGNELSLKNGIRDLLSVLRAKEKKIGLVSKSEKEDATIDEQPVIKILKAFDMLHYFNDVISIDRNMPKSIFVPNDINQNHILFLDDDVKNLIDITKHTDADAIDLNVHNKFVASKDSWYKEASELENQEAPNPMNDYNYALDAVLKDPLNLFQVPIEIMYDHPDIAIEAVKKAGAAIKAVPEDIQLKYPDIPLEALKEDGDAIEYVSEELLEDEDLGWSLILEAIKTNPEAIEYVYEFTVDMLKEAVAVNFGILRYLPSEVTDHVIDYAVDNNELAVSYASEETKNKYIGNPFSASEIDNRYPNSSVYERAKASNYKILGYHGTSMSLLNKISNTGSLVSPKLIGNERHESRKWALDQIFITTNSNYALEYSNNAASDTESDPVVLIFSIPILKTLEGKILTGQIKQNELAEKLKEKNKGSADSEYVNESGAPMEEAGSMQEVVDSLYKIGWVELTLESSLSFKHLLKAINLRNGEDITNFVKAACSSNFSYRIAEKEDYVKEKNRPPKPKGDKVLDHKKPKWKGGTDSKENLQWVSKEEHKKKTKEEGSYSKGGEDRHKKLKNDGDYNDFQSDAAKSKVNKEKKELGEKGFSDLQRERVNKRWNKADTNSWYKSAKEVLPGGLSSGKPDSDFDPKQLKKGIEVELEHTDNKELAKEIAKDHLTEDPKYYDHLKEMEDKYVKDAGNSSWYKASQVQPVGNVGYLDIGHGEERYNDYRDVDDVGGDAVWAYTNSGFEAHYLRDIAMRNQDNPEEDPVRTDHAGVFENTEEYWAGRFDAQKNMVSVVPPGRLLIRNPKIPSPVKSGIFSNFGDDVQIVCFNCREANKNSWYRMAQVNPEDIPYYLNEDGDLVINDLDEIADDQWQEISDGMVELGYDWRGGADAYQFVEGYIQRSGKVRGDIYSDLVGTMKEVLMPPLYSETQTEDDQKYHNETQEILRNALDPTSEVEEGYSAGFGVTNDLHEAGYILADGRLLDFSGSSGGGGQRSFDHREIGKSYPLHIDIDSPEGERSDYMNDFMDRGNIRMSLTPGDGFGFIHTVTEPTNQQYSRIREMIRAISSARGEFLAQVGKESQEFAPQLGNSYSNIIPYIKSFFGAQASSGAQIKTAQKLYSLREDFDDNNQNIYIITDNRDWDYGFFKTRKEAEKLLKKMASKDSFFKEATKEELEMAFRQAVESIRKSVEVRQQKNIEITPDQIFAQKVKAYKKLLRDEFNILIDSFSEDPDRDMEYFIQGYDLVPKYERPTRFDNPIVGEREEKSAMDEELKEFFASRLINASDVEIMWAVKRAREVIEQDKKLKDQEQTLYKIVSPINTFIKSKKLLENKDIQNYKDVESLKEAVDQYKPKLPELDDSDFEFSPDMSEAYIDYESSLWEELVNDYGRYAEDEEGGYLVNEEEIEEMYYDRLKEEQMEDGFEKEAPPEPVSQEVIEGDIYHLYHGESLSDYKHLGHGTSWCFRGDKDYDPNFETAREYLENGDIWVIFKNGKPFRALDLISKQYMNVDDEEVEIDELKETFKNFYDILRPETRQKALNELNYDFDKLVTSHLLNRDDGEEFWNTINEMISKPDVHASRENPTSRRTNMELIQNSVLGPEDGDLYDTAVVNAMQNKHNVTKALELAKGQGADMGKYLGIASDKIFNEEDGKVDLVNAYNIFRDGIMTREEYPEEFQKLNGLLYEYIASDNLDKIEDGLEFVTTLSKNGVLTGNDEILNLSVDKLSILSQENPSSKLTFYARTLLNSGVFEKGSPSFEKLVPMSASKTQSRANNDFINIGSMILEGTIGPQDVEKYFPAAITEVEEAIEAAVPPENVDHTNVNIVLNKTQKAIATIMSAMDNFIITPQNRPDLYERGLKTFMDYAEGDYTTNTFYWNYPALLASKVIDWKNNPDLYQEVLDRAVSFNPELEKDIVNKYINQSKSYPYGFYKNPIIENFVFNYIENSGDELNIATFFRMYPHTINEKHDRFVPLLQKSWPIIESYLGNDKEKIEELKEFLPDQGGQEIPEQESIEQYPEDPIEEPVQEEEKVASWY